MSINEGLELNITEVEWVSGYTLKVSFSDGFDRDIDFGLFLSRSTHPEIRKYLDVERFKGFEISYGNLIWNDYDLCFPMADLYSGCLIPEEVLIGKVAEDGPEYRTGA